MLKSYPLNILKVQSQRLAVGDKFSFSLTTVPLIIHINNCFFIHTYIYMYYKQSEIEKSTRSLL